MIIRTMVAAAALAVLAGVASVQVGAQASTAPPAAAGPTFARDVAPIFYKNCTNCHRPGEIAPMSLLTFKDARPWARSIATRVAKGTMPPWHADPSHGEFLNDRRLTELEKNTIVQWVNAGAPEGSPADLPAEPTYATEWLNLVGRWLPSKNLEIYGSIRNIFDRIAPLDPLTYGQTSFNPLDYAGAIGRFYTVGLRYRFF